MVRQGGDRPRGEVAHRANQRGGAEGGNRTHAHRGQSDSGVPRLGAGLQRSECRRWESNPHSPEGKQILECGAWAPDSSVQSAEGGNRTHTPRREPDFESGASASSATSARMHGKRCRTPPSKAEANGLKIGQEQGILAPCSSAEIRSGWRRKREQEVLAYGPWCGRRGFGRCGRLLRERAGGG